MFHLLDRHMVPVSFAIAAAFRRLELEFADRFETDHLMYFGLELAIIVVQGIAIIFFIVTIGSCYDVLICLVRRVSPFSILASAPLSAYLLNKTKHEELVGTSPEERIIHDSHNCIICLDRNGGVELTNPSVAKVFGYTPEQVLGLPLTTLMTSDAGEKIEAQIRLMADRQAAPLFEDHTVCLSDSGVEIHCSISILAIFQGDEVSSYVAVLKDESALISQQKEAESAKRQSETLLYQILPRSIVTRLNAGEKDISFSIPSATVSFIDIVKFSEFASSLTPQEIMGNLSLVFSGFDEKIIQYDRLLKIKLIGDVYMSAGGLFDPEKPPTTHAEQMVRFTLDAIRVIEEVNIQLDTTLAIRIGVNTGGPILAGILGTDKPTFDIIGDAINIAARLQSTDLPGYVQISEATHALIAGSDFTIAPRGEVMLKGKGKQLTYLVESDLKL
jgi:PAS domain S-box-containing protein